jgi:hypothetical protein
MRSEGGMYPLLEYVAAWHYRQELLLRIEVRTFTFGPVFQGLARTDPDLGPIAPEIEEVDDPPVYLSRPSIACIANWLLDDFLPAFT